MDFEKSMARLSEISEAMGSGDMPLERSIALYSEAMELVKSCKEYIDRAKLTVEQLENPYQ